MYNETFGWFSILAGFFLGLYLGIKFQREDWLGGYSALPRRMVRMAHIAMVALGMLNVQFGQSLHRMELSPWLAGVASWALIAGALLMPASCLWIALGSRRFEIFAAPITCLVAGLLLTVGGHLR